MRIKRTLLLTALLTTVAIPSFAQPDIFGRTGLYDMTGDPTIEGLRLDQSFVTGGEPTFSELKGLAGAPVVEVRRNFMYVQDADRTLNIPAQSGRDLGEWFNFAGREVYRVFPDEFVFFILYTTFDSRVGAFFYSPEANDIRGIAGNGLFDQNGSSPREGIVFMNYYLALEQQYRQLGPQAVRAQQRSVFNQEVGHRWGAFTPLGAQNGGGADILLGRDDGHWSFFMNSGGSPMEGNSWRDNGNGTFTTTTDLNNFFYNDLDLYLMGLLDPADAAPWFVIDNADVNGQQDLFGQTVNRASPPHIISGFRGNEITVSGTRVEQDVDMIARRHGRRDPSHVEAPRSFRTVFILLSGASSPASENVLNTFEGMIDDYATGWAEGTGNRAELDYILMEEIPKTPIGGACTEAMECDPADATICVSYPPEAQSLCTRPCQAVTDCPGDWCCKSLGAGSANVCMSGPICNEPDPDPDPDPDPMVCACDLTSGACDAGCACDSACGFIDGICSCDVTTVCNVGPSGGDCLCDPECPVESSCGCTSTNAAGGSSLAFLFLVATGFALRRKRR